MDLEAQLRNLLTRLGQQKMAPFRRRVSLGDLLTERFYTKFCRPLAR
jgi:hypothetical protein